MLKIQEIRELIKLVDQSNIEEFVYELDGSKIQMKKRGANEQQVVSKVVTVEQPKPEVQVVQANPQPVVEQQKAVEPVVQTAPVSNENLHKIVSPMVGTFYSAPSPDADPYVKVGDKVTESSIVCIVEAMKLFNEIEAEVNGEIVEVLVQNGQLVEYGQPLFLVKQ